MWQSRNDQRVPGEGGTKFSLSDIDDGPFTTYRVYVGHRFLEKHEVRALYAPLRLEANGQLASPTTFGSTLFSANTPTRALYKFNSYRLTYSYYLPQKNDWEFAVGFTAKVRDAEVRLTQGALSDFKSNVGFVPLLHAHATRTLCEDWKFRFDFDGLAAPQGRAFDVAFFLERNILKDKLSAFGGYRTVEGGADNDEVYNFAWLHYATIGLTGNF